VQRLLERDARGGTRYVELLLSHFGVVSSDARLQRSEYLGGGTLPVLMQAVPQTSETTSIYNPLGRLGAYGVTVGQPAGFTRSFEEHGIVLGLVSFRADINYQQGMPRMFSRESRWDFYWPALAHLGEQAVLSKEIFCQGESADDDVFGYQERWSEYRYKPSMITGELRSQSATPLDVWHLAQEFATRPVLGADFIKESPPMSRVQVYTTDNQFLVDCHFGLRHARPLPTWSVPGLIDHF